MTFHDAALERHNQQVPFHERERIQTNSDALESDHRQSKTSITSQRPSRVENSSKAESNASLKFTFCGCLTVTLLSSCNNMVDGQKVYGVRFVVNQQDPGRLFL